MKKLFLPYFRQKEGINPNIFLLHIDLYNTADQFPYNLLLKQHLILTKEI